MKEKVKLSKLVLPTMFCSSIIFIGFINIDNFRNSYKKAIEENPNDKKVALSTVESKYANNFKAKNNYININGAFANLIDKKELNGIIKLKNGYLIEPINPIDINYLVSNTLKFNQYLSNKKIPFLYIQEPFKMPTDSSFLYKGFKSYANKIGDNLIKGLEKNNIETLDLRSEIKNDNIDHYSLFYKTDHHWTTKAGFWAHTKMTKKINEILKVDYINSNYTNIENYNICINNNNFLGETIARTGDFFTDHDVLELITPKFDTNFTLEIPSRNIKLSGTFEDTFVSKENKGYYQYFNGLYDYVKINNINSTNNKKLIILGDSYNVTTIPFLSLHYKEIHWFDLRWGSNLDMLKKINEINPDIVICSYFAGATHYDVNKPLFNFINDDIIKQLEEEN